MIKEVVIEADDAMPSLYFLPILEEIKSHIPNFKITLFTVAHGDSTDIKQHIRWSKMIKKYDWIEIAYHGLEHKDGEFLCSYDEALKKIKEMKKYFRKMKTGNYYFQDFRRSDLLI